MWMSLLFPLLLILPCQSQYYSQYYPNGYSSYAYNPSTGQYSYSSSSFQYYSSSYSRPRWVVTMGANSDETAPVVYATDNFGDAAGTAIGLAFGKKK